MLLSVLFARYDDPADLVRQPRLSRLAKLVMQLVQSLDRSLGQRRVVSPPDRGREDDDVGGEHLLEYPRPFVALAHVVLRARLDHILDEANDFALDVVLSKFLGNDLGQDLGVRKLAALRLERAEQEECFGSGQKVSAKISAK